MGLLLNFEIEVIVLKTKPEPAGRPEYLTESSSTSYILCCALMGLFASLIGPLLVGVVYSDEIVVWEFQSLALTELSKWIVPSAWGMLSVAIALAATSLAAVAFVGIHEPTDFNLQKRRKLAQVASGLMWIAGGLLTTLAWTMLTCLFALAAVDERTTATELSRDVTFSSGGFEAVLASANGWLVSFVSIFLLFVFQKLFVAVQLWVDGDNNFLSRERTHVEARIEAGEYLLDRVNMHLSVKSSESDKLQREDREPVLNEKAKSRRIRLILLVLRTLLPLGLSILWTGLAISRWSDGGLEDFLVATIFGFYNLALSIAVFFYIQISRWIGPKLTDLEDHQDAARYVARMRAGRFQFRRALPALAGLVIPLILILILYRIGAPPTVLLHSFFGQVLIGLTVLLPGVGSWEEISALEASRILQMRLEGDRRWKNTLLSKFVIPVNGKAQQTETAKPGRLDLVRLLRRIRVLR